MQASFKKLVVGALLAAVVIPGTAAAAPDDPPPEDKSMLVAMALSTGTVAVGVGAISLDNRIVTPSFLVGLGLLTVGPSLGHLYAGEHRRAATGVGMRAGCLVVATGLLMVSDGGRDTEAVIVAGLTLYGFMGLGIWHLIDAPFSVRRVNRRARARRLTVTPLAPAGDSRLGLSIGGVF